MWEKHKQDILWLKSKGFDIIPDLYEALIEFWKTDLGDKSFLSLNKDKKQFFTDNVVYKYDHDYLHELVAHPNRPVYEGCLKDNAEVLIDKAKFDMLPFDKQVRMFREEITVIACERWLLNDYWCGKISWYEAYIASLKKTITNLTKNWACDFIVLNLEEFVKPDYSYFENLLNVLIKEETIMSQVDLSVFEEMNEIMSTDYSYSGRYDLNTFVYALCEGEVFVSDEESGIIRPDKGDREWHDPAYQSELDIYWDAKKKYLNDVIGYTHLEQEGGGEGGSEYCYGVFELKGKIYKAEYQYYSHHGHEYDSILDTLQEVKPVEKTITVYE